MGESGADEPALKRRKQYDDHKSSMGSVLPFHLNYIPDLQKGSAANASTKKFASYFAGEFTHVVLYNYKIDLKWVYSQVPKLKEVPVVVVHGAPHNSEYHWDLEEFRILLKDDNPSRNLDIRFPQRSVMPWGTHHSKMMLIYYPRGVRVVVTTANYILRDWERQTECTWAQDFPLKASQHLKIHSEFEDYLSKYLSVVGGCDLEDLRRYDFSSATVSLVASVPGRHDESSSSHWGYGRLRALLNSEKFSPDASTPAGLVCQFTSLGDTKKEWLSTILGAMSPDTFSLQSKDISFVIPTKNEVLEGLDGEGSGACIPIRQKNVEKLNRHLSDMQRQEAGEVSMHFCKWQGHTSNGEPRNSNHHCGAVDRARALPHMKSYLQYCGSHIPWALITSHNLSKAAWGEPYRNAGTVIRSYEMGVLFLPSIYFKNVIAASNFSLSPSEPLYPRLTALTMGKEGTGGWERRTFFTTHNTTDSDDCARLPIPYVIPPRRYDRDQGDECWTVQPQ